MDILKSTITAVIALKTLAADRFRWQPCMTRMPRPPGSRGSDCHISAFCFLSISKKSSVSHKQFNIKMHLIRRRVCCKKSEACLWVKELYSRQNGIFSWGGRLATRKLTPKKNEKHLVLVQRMAFHEPDVCNKHYVNCGTHLCTCASDWRNLW